MFYLIEISSTLIVIFVFQVPRITATMLSTRKDISDYMSIDFITNRFYTSTSTSVNWENTEPITGLPSTVLGLPNFLRQEESSM